MYLAIITLPLLGSVVSGFFGRKVGVSGAQLITCTSVIVTTLLSIVAFFEVGLNNIPVSINLFRWIDSESLNVLWGFHFDSLTVSMLIPVLIVSSLVHIYSIGYMSHDPHNQRFFSYLSLFTFMMIILVTANNFLLMFVGWEGVGICSYLLVSFWFTRIAANQSSMSAFLTNRVGDCFLTIGMFAILWSFGNIDYSTVFSLAPFVNENIITIIGICLLIGAMAKSSQVGLHVWLPMAMEGPTPVSALIHAATMVTAGVYLLMRTSPLIEYSSTVLILCLWLGAITTVFSSLIGLFQQDIKKVIAYSTMSQLGMMVIAVGLSSYNIALFHLVNHAFYKGLLFLGAGAVIHAVADNQDFRKYGGLRPFLPLTYSVMLIASLSLVAFPFMTGFYSKDFILESAYGQFYFSGTVVYFIATIGAMFTTLYSVKVLYLTFLTNPNGPVVNYKNAHESDIFMSLPLIILAVFSIFFGYITKDIFIGLGSAFFSDNSLFIHPTHEIMLDTEFAVPTLFKLLPLVFTIFFSVLAIIISEFLGKVLLHFKFTRLGYNIFGFFNQRFLIELFYNKYITGLVLNLGGQTTKVIDKGSVELLGPYGLEKGLINLSRNIASLDTGVITSYALYILIGIIFYILIPYLAIFDKSLLLLILLSLFSIVNNYTTNIDNNILDTKLLVLRSDFNLLSVLPDVLDGINIISSKVLPIVNTSTNILPDILDNINNIIKEVLPTVGINENGIHNAQMQYLAENYSHVLKMKSIALNILYDKANGSNFVPNNPYLIKDIGSILNNTYLPTLGSISCSPLNHWGIFIHYNSLYLYKYMFYFVPIVLPFISSIVGLMFNIFDSSKDCLFFLLSFLINIISNCLLYLIYMLEFIFYIITLLLHLGFRFYTIFIFILNLFISYLNNFMLLFKYCKSTMFNTVNHLNIYILNILNLFFINSKKYLPIYSIMYIYNQPQFIKIAFIYILRNISIKWLFLKFIANIKYIYHISWLNIDLNYLINQYLMYIDYIDLCFESGKFLPLIQYKRYMAWLNAVDNHINSLEQLLIERTSLLNLLRTLVSENLYICGHGRSGNPNVILSIQVSARARAMLGLNRIDQHCLRIVAVYKSIDFSEDEYQIIRLCWNAQEQLLGINPNYSGNIININNQLMRVHVDRSNLIGISHNVNEFYIVDIYRDGTLRYIYFF
jgi:NADH-ubiquinone oxidoreductase chain 5